MRPLQLTLQFEMGNANDSTQEELVFVQALQDRHFGQVEIFRSQEGLFVMKVCRTVIQGDKRHQQQLKLMEELQGVTSIIPIIHLKRTQEKGICIKYERMEIFTEYYNFTLADLMGTKKEMEEAELWLLLTSLLSLASELKKKLSCVNFTLDTVFLTPSGAPCVYHYHIHSCRESISYSELTMGQSIGKVLLQLALGMQLKDCTQQELLKQEGLFIRAATKYKLLGSCIKELITEGTTEESLKEEIEILKQQQLIHVATEVKLLKFKYHLPQNPQFLNIPTLSKTPSSASAKANKENDLVHPLSKSIAKKVPNHNASKQDQSRKILQTEGSNNKERIISQISSVFNNSSSKKESVMKQDIFKTKEQTSKMLGELDRKKEENRLQREKFEQRKEKLIKAGIQNQKILQTRKSERKVDEGRKVTDPAQNGRFR